MKGNESQGRGWGEFYEGEGMGMEGRIGIGFTDTREEKRRGEKVQS